MQSLPKVHPILIVPGVVWCFLIIIALGPCLVQAEPEPMARPTRPKVISSPEELRRYLDRVTDYYTLNGKARYGKRGSVLDSTPYLDHLWDVLRTLANAQRQLKQQREDRDKDNGQMLQDFDFEGHHAGTRPLYPPEILPKFYDDIQ